MKLGITGDTHGDQYFTQMYKARKMGLTHLIVCGDFGYIWNGSSKEQRRLNYLSKIGVTILFIDGNHENFTLLNQYPKETLFGGRVHKIRDNIFHLMRGEIYDIEGKKFFTFGGANSTDLVYYNMYGKRKERKEGKDWWREERPSVDDKLNATENLTKHDFKVDCIVTHTCFYQAIEAIGGDPKRKDDVADFLNGIKNIVNYNKWYFGHFHTTQCVEELGVHCLGKSVIELKLEEI